MVNTSKLALSRNTLIFHSRRQVAVSLFASYLQLPRTVKRSQRKAYLFRLHVCCANLAGATAVHVCVCRHMLHLCECREPGLPLAYFSASCPGNGTFVKIPALITSFLSHARWSFFECLSRIPYVAGFLWNLGFI